MTTPQQWENMIGLTATDADSDKIGQVGQVYLDEGTGKPEWVTVSTGMFGTRQSFAPLYGSSVRGDQLVLAVSRQLVKDAPPSKTTAAWTRPRSRRCISTTPRTSIRPAGAGWKTPATPATPAATPTPGRAVAPRARTPTLR
jgi:hypothetical protein